MRRAAWAVVAIVGACGSPPEMAMTPSDPTGAPVIVDDAPAAVTTPPDDGEPQAMLEMWWSDAGTAIARCVRDDHEALTLLTASGEQQPLSLDYPQPGWAPYAIGEPAWQPGAEIVALPHDRGVVLWDATARRARETLAVVGGTSAPKVSYSPEGKRLATFVPLGEREGEETLVQLWDASGTLVKQVRPDARVTTTTRQISLGTGGDVVGTGEGVIVGMESPLVGERVVVTSIASNAVKVLDGHTVVAHANGLWAVASGLDGGEGLAPASTTIYGAFGGAKLAKVPGAFPVWTANGKALKTEAEDAVFLSAADGRTLLRIPAAGEPFWARAEPSPNGMMLAVATQEGVALWDVASQRRTRTLIGNSISAWLGNEVVATSAAGGRRAHVASTKSEKRVDISASLQAGICRLRLSTAEGEGLAAATLASLLGAPPPAAGTVAPGPRAALPDPAVRLTHGEARSSVELALSWSPDEAAFVASSPTRPRTLVDLRTGVATALPEAPENATQDFLQVWWNRASTHVAFRASGAIEAWQRAPAHRAGSVPIPEAAHADAYWAPSAGRLAVSWFHDVTRITLFDVSVGGVTTTLTPTPPDYPALVSWRPDGRQLLTQPSQSVMQLEVPTHLQVWDARSGRAVASFTPTSKDHVQATFWTLWDPSGAVVYSGAGAGTFCNMSRFTGTKVALWDAATGRTLGSLPGHTAIVEPSGKYLAVVDGHPWRAVEHPRTTFYALGTRRELVSVSGVPVAFDPEGRWTITATYPYSSSNMPSSEAVIYRLWDLPGGATPMPRVRSRGRLALGTFDDRQPVDYLGDSRFVVWSDNPQFAKEGLRFDVWDLTTSSRVAAGRFDGRAAMTARRWLRDGRILQLRYDDGRHRFVAVKDGTWLDVSAAPDGSLHVHDASGTTSWNALAKLLER